MEKHMSAELVKRIEDLAAEMEQFREDPVNSAFVDADHLLEFVEVELEDCMVELLDLPIPEQQSLLDRTIKAVYGLGSVSEAIGKILSIFG